MLFEKVVPLYTNECIKLSELLLRTESDRSADWSAYLDGFRAMLEKIKTVKLHCLPLFEWKGVNSTCWKFEEYRVMHELHVALLLEAKELYGQKDYGETKNKLSEALQLSKDMINIDWYLTPYVRAMPEMRVTYKLSKMLATRSLQSYNAYSFKPSSKMARMAYQLTEISNKLWKPCANVEFENKLLSEYYYSKAQECEFPQKLSYITAAKNCNPVEHIVELYDSVTRLNETVYYMSAEPVECPLLTLEEALSKC